ncbi:hypothetical protein DMUE_3391 [Dictyocoela muelleri]|nr:hypothetical protein DMUE_3391 [Dictyocoela muelleri]
MARLNIRECSEIYSIINSTEETMIEQMKTVKVKQKHEKRISNKDKMHFKQSENNASKHKQKYCEFHNVYTHDSSECHAKLKAKNKEPPKNPKTNNTFAIKKTIPRISALETTGTINNKGFNLILDTGSAYSYIDGKIVTELGLKREDVDERVSITVDGSKIVTKQESTFHVNLQGDKCNNYKITARILNNTLADLILGVDFMKNNKAIINLEESTIRLDNKIYELQVTDKTVADEIFANKSNIMCINQTKITTDIERLISEYKSNNLTVGTIDNTSQKIQYKSVNIVNLTPYRVPINIREQTNDEIKRLLKLKIIQKSDSPFYSRSPYTKKKR